MNSPRSNENRLAYQVIGHGMVVLLIGLLAGIMLIFSLLDAVTLWPLPAWEISIPGSTRGWQAAHVGGILNGVMIGGAALLMMKLALTGKGALWVGWGMIITGWANTLFYWAGNLSAWYSPSLPLRFLRSRPSSAHGAEVILNSLQRLKSAQVFSQLEVPGTLFPGPSQDEGSIQPEGHAEKTDRFIASVRGELDRFKGFLEAAALL